MRGASRRAAPALVALVTTALGAASVGACSLAIGGFDECSSDADCEAGLRCAESLCVSAAAPDGAAPCQTDDECRQTLGYGGVCELSACIVAPTNAHCLTTEPPELVDELAGGVTDRLLLGAVFKLQASKELARANAIRLAIREMNEAGGIAGQQLGVVLCDNDLDGVADNDSQETEETTLYLAGALGVRVIVGPSSSANATAATNTLLTEKLATVIVSPSATSSTLTNLLDRFDPSSDPYGLFWRTCPSDALQGEVLADTIDEMLTGPTKRVLVAYQRDPYGQGLEESFRSEFEAKSADHQVASTSFEVDESDLAGAATSIQAALPADALLVISGDAKRTVHVLEQVTTSAAVAALPLFLTDGSKDAAVLLDPANAAAVAAMVQSARGTAPARPSGTAYDTFANNMQTVFGVDPAEFSFVAQSYDAVYAGVFGLVHATGPGEAYDGFDVAAGLSRLVAGESVNVGPTGFTTGVSELRGTAKQIDLEGTSGPLDFDTETGEAPGPIEVWKVGAAGDAFETVSVVTP